LSDAKSADLRETLDANLHFSDHPYITSSCRAAGERHCGFRERTIAEGTQLHAKNLGVLLVVKRIGDGDA